MPRRADAQPRGNDRPGGVGLCEPAAPHELAVLSDRTVEVALLLAKQAALQLPHENAELPLGCAARAPAGARKAVPGPCEGQEVRAPSPAVRGEHRAHASVTVHVGTRDDARVCVHALEHRLAGGHGQAVDRATQIVDRSCACANTV